MLAWRVCGPGFNPSTTKERRKEGGRVGKGGVGEEEEGGGRESGEREGSQLCGSHL